MPGAPAAGPNDSDDDMDTTSSTSLPDIGRASITAAASSSTAAAASSSMAAAASSSAAAAASSSAAAPAHHQALAVRGFKRPVEDLIPPGSTHK